MKKARELQFVSLDVGSSAAANFSKQESASVVDTQETTFVQSSNNDETPQGLLRQAFSYLSTKVRN